MYLVNKEHKNLISQIVLVGIKVIASYAHDLKGCGGVVEKIDVITEQIK